MEKQATTTLIRTIYSDGLSYCVIKFYNTSLAFQFVPFQRKDETGKNVYDTTRSQSTTITADSAYTLFQFGTEILEGKIKDGQVTVNGNNSQLTLETNSVLQSTTFTISKNGQVIPFKFAVSTISTQENGIPTQRTIQAGLGSFTKMLEGYLTGINADRHLNKLTDDYVKSLETTDQQTQPKPTFTQQKPPYQKKQWNNNQQWKKPFNNYNQNPPTSWETQQPNQQNFSSYKINK